MQTTTCCSWPLFQSRDLLSALSPFLHINDLLQCSALSTSLHSFYDSDLTWSPRLTHAIAIAAVPPPPADSASAVDAVVHSEPMPLVEVIALIDHFVKAERDDESVLDAVVFDPATGLYHVHYTAPAPHPDLRITHIMIRYEIVRLQWSGEQHQWVVHEHAGSPAGLLAVNVCNITGGCLHAPVTARTAKAEYIACRACSQHREQACWRLLPPFPPLPTPSHWPRDLFNSRRDNTVLEPSPLPPLSPMPLCSACRQLTAGVLQRWCDVWFGRRHADWPPMQPQCVVRINELEYDVRFGARSNTSQSRRFRIERSAAAGGEEQIVCHAQCNPAPGMYSVATPSNVVWDDTAPPTTPARTVQVEAHAARCSATLLHYAANPYFVQGQDREGACAVCNQIVDHDVFHCSRCWYDVCGPCADVMMERSPTISSQ